MDNELIAETGFTLLIAAVAFLYASVGHGGASGYLALGALFGVSSVIMKPSALILNILVAGISFWQYRKGGYFRKELFWPFVITSVPASFLGSFITLDDAIYKKILGVLLLFAVARILGLFGKAKSEIKRPAFLGAMIIGAGIGTLSGMIGIGGGIILTPVILLLGWGDLKETAAASAIFIFVNSIAGLAGQMIQGISFPGEVYIWILAALAGGISGAWAGSFKLNGVALKGILAFTLAIACFKLILT